VADLPISGLPDAAALTGVEQVEIVQSGGNVKTTAQAIANLFVPPAAGAVDQLAVVTSTVTLTGSTNDTSAHSFNLPAGTLDPNDVLEAYWFGDLQNNTGGSGNYTFRVKIGGTTVLASAAFAVATGGTRRSWDLRFTLNMRGIADTYGFAVINMTNAAAAGTTNSVATLHAGYTGQVTVDMDAAARLIELSMQQSLAGSDFRVHGGFYRRVTT